MIYDLIAPIYDAVNSDVDYVKWADFIERLIAKYYTPTPKPELILDLGCGTGRMTVELASRGYDMTGVDISCDMLDRAREYATARGCDKDILWLMQDMREFELYGTVDVTVSCLDCINHLTSKADLERTLRLVHNYLIPNGLFIFDMNGKSKFENVYADNSYVMEDEGDFCVWRNFYDEKSKLCDFVITLFKENPDGTYDRYDEEQTERMYTLRSMRTALLKCGFEVLGVFSDYDRTPATDDDERIYIVAKCIKENQNEQ